MRRTLTSLAAALAVCLAPATRVHAAPDVQPLLDAGDFDAAAARLEAALEADPADHDARLALGVTTFLAGVEELAQAAWAHGLIDITRELGAVAGVGGVLPMGLNEKPLPTSVEDVEAALEAFASALAATDAVLAPIGDAEARMSFRPGTVRVDVNGDGVPGEGEGLWRFLEAMTADPWAEAQVEGAGEPGSEDAEAPPSEMRQAADGFVLGLDTADAYWLRGYCHLLGGALDVVLGYDGRELFERTGHLFFRNVAGAEAWRYSWRGLSDFNAGAISDWVAVVHLLNQPVRDPARLAAAREKFLGVADLSRKTWASILAETDDDREWLPGPGQTGVIGVGIEQAQVDAWLGFLDEAEQLLNGELLLPFWRGAEAPQTDENGDWIPPDFDAERTFTHPTLGVNLKRVFTEPTRFDLILWIQGTQAAPYLEEGPRTQPDFWLRLNEAFDGQFPGFAAWIN